MLSRREQMLFHLHGRWIYALFHPAAVALSVTSSKPANDASTDNAICVVNCSDRLHVRCFVALISDPLSHPQCRVANRLLLLVSLATFL